MSSELDEFRLRVIAHAKAAAARAPNISSEAGTNISLVLPFLTVLGYDPLNPEEVSPEHHADFSEKYQNKVDYAILSGSKPVISIESKCVGSPIKDDRGQLRSYFNACPTVKLGILTDGMKYEFYADSDKPNMMDEAAFLRFDFAEIAKSGSVDENTLGGIAAIRNGSFNPENVGAEAKQKLLFESIVETIKQFKSEPSDDFIRFILGRPEIGAKIKKVTQGIVDSNREIVRAAMEAFVAQEALARFGYAPKDVVKTSTERQEAAPAPAPAATQQDQEGDALRPSDTELEVLSYAKNRLFYLVRSDVLFQEVQKLTFKKGRTSFRVFYEKPNSGSLFDLREYKDGRTVLQFPVMKGQEVEFKPSSELDECLIQAFTQRVTEAGVSFEATPVLRSIEGRQAS